MSRRLALMIATYRHQDAGLRQLTAPAQDAEELADVLRHPDIAGFEVTILVNESNSAVGRAIGEFYRSCRRDDLALLYFTGHGVKDDQGRLYLAMADTRLDDLIFTAVSAQQIDDAIESCPSRQKILALDCCYSGAFPRGRFLKADSRVHTLERFQGKGRVVLTASDATQYSFEGDRVYGRGGRSVFTRYLVEGLRTGQGDLDGDGDICLDELYSYVYERVVEEVPQQRPKKLESVEGRIVFARNIHWTLPDYLVYLIESPIIQNRLIALDHLAHLHRAGNEFVRSAVVGCIRQLAHDGSAEVSASAERLLAKFGIREGLDTSDQQSTGEHVADPIHKTRAGSAEQDGSHTRVLLPAAVSAAGTQFGRDLPRTGLAVTFMFIAALLLAVPVFVSNGHVTPWTLVRSAFLVVAGSLLLTGVYEVFALGVACGVALWNLQLLGLLALLGTGAGYVAIFTGTLLLILALVLVCLQSSRMTAAVSLSNAKSMLFATLMVLAAISVDGVYGSPSHWGGWPEWSIHASLLTLACLTISLSRINSLQCATAVTAIAFFVVHTIFWRVLALGGVGITDAAIWIDITASILVLAVSCLAQRTNLTSSLTVLRDRGPSL